MSPAGFETAIPACERRQTHALHSAATGIGLLLSIGFDLESPNVWYTRTNKVKRDYREDVRNYCLWKWVNTIICTQANRPQLRRGPMMLLSKVHYWCQLYPPWQSKNRHNHFVRSLWIDSCSFISSDDTRLKSQIKQTISHTLAITRLVSGHPVTYDTIWPSGLALLLMCISFWKVIGALIHVTSRECGPLQCLSQVTDFQETWCWCATIPSGKDNKAKAHICDMAVTTAPLDTRSWNCVR
jgi:hypothetical protein